MYKWGWAFLAVLGIPAGLVTLVGNIYQGLADKELIFASIMMLIFGLFGLVFMFKNEEQQKKLYPYMEKFGYVICFGALVLAIIELQDSVTSSLKTFSLAVFFYIATKVYWKAYWDNENAKEMNEQERRKIATKGEIAISSVFLGSYVFKMILTILN